MKKFIAPEVSVVRYDTSILCASIGMGDDIGEGESIDADAPGRRRGIFDDSETTTSTRL
ncbi:MAG: hypothetical protein IKO63_04435 [Paludibacteraceae bacterium]|nr:hypothetical protein [Paludibacteraceae bacterium]